jgi:hypothetical protein
VYQLLCDVSLTARIGGKSNELYECCCFNIHSVDFIYDSKFGPGTGAVRTVSSLEPDLCHGYVTCDLSTVVQCSLHRQMRGDRG